MSWLDNTLYLTGSNRLPGLDFTPYVTADNMQQQDLQRQEKRYRHSIESSPMAVIVHREGRIVHANMAAIELAGGEKPDDLVGEPLLDFIRPDHHQDALALVKHMAQEPKETEVLSHKFVRLDGYMIDVEVIAIPTTHHGKPATQAIILEANRSRRAEQSESDQHQTVAATRKMIASLSNILDLDEILQLILANLQLVAPHDAANIMLIKNGIARIVKQSGYAEQGQSEAVLAARYQNAGAAYLLQVAKTGCALVIHDTNNHPDWIISEQTRWIRSHVSAPIHIDGTLIGFINLDSGTPDSFNNVHARQLQAFANQVAVAIQSAQLYKQMQRHAAELEKCVAERTSELQAAEERIRALNQTKEEFLSNITYELRTPITSIQLYHDLLELTPENNRVYIERLRTETSRVVRIIDGLMQLSRMDQEHVKADLATVDLNQLVEMSTTDSQPLAERKGIRLTIYKQADLPSLKVAPELISQALKILLSNAINYTPAGGRVMVKTQTSQFEGMEWVGICVSDNGPGILLEEQPRLFERFYRGKAGRESDIAGIGLGLTIAKQITDQHLGRIEVESQGVPGLGATFRIWLPSGHIEGF